MLHTQSLYLNYIVEVEKLLVEVSICDDSLGVLQKDLNFSGLLVPVIGAFSSGKSTLLNSFLGEDVLAVGLTPETELATELRYDESPHLIAVHHDGSSERMSVDALKSIKSRAAEFTHLQLFLNNQNLKTIAPLVLVDMPGFGSSLSNHNKAIAYYLPRGVHFIVLTSIEDGNITQSIMRQLDDIQTYECDFSFLLGKTNLRAEDQVREVAALIGDQIRMNFGDNHAVISVGHGGGKELSDVLTKLMPEQIVRGLFEERLKLLTHTLFDQINVALSSLKRTQVENEHALHELSNGLRKIERERDRIIEDLRGQRMDIVLNRCLSVVGRELEDAHEELVKIGLSGDQEAFSRTISEIVRGAMARTLKEQMEGISYSVVEEFSSVLSSLGQTMASFTGEESWLPQLSSKINTLLNGVNKTLGTWSESLAQRHTQELEQRKKDGKWKDGDPLPQLTYRGLATVLAITTTVVAPVLELVIIFLPDILAFLGAKRQKEQLSQKILNEVIPAVKRELRSKTPVLLSEQLESMIAQISAEFEREIVEKQQIIQRFQSDKQVDNSTTEYDIMRMVKIKEQLQQLAKSVLYSGVQS